MIATVNGQFIRFIDMQQGTLSHQGDHEFKLSTTKCILRNNELIATYNLSKYEIYF